MFGRQRRRRKLRTRRHPQLSAGVGAKATQEPWVALPLEELTQGAKPPTDEISPPRPKPGPPSAPQYPSFLVVPIVLLVGAAALFVIQSSVRTTLTQSWIADPSISSLETATTIASNNALGWLRLGLTQANEGSADEAESSLRRAIALSPSDSTPRVALGLALERSGRFDDAELAFLDAANVDAGFAVRWSIANFYLRAGDRDSVWRWLHAAILADPTQLPVAASLGWRANADPGEVLDNAIPDQLVTNRGYFTYLYDIGQLDAMRQAWPRFSATLTSIETPIATRYIDRLISAGLVKEAVLSWNLLSDKILIPHAPLGPETNRFLTNPLFATAPSGVGFDWHAGEHRGVSWSHLPTSAGRSAVEFRLSGAQESGLTLLSQIMPVAPGQYSLEFEMATQGMPTRTGVGWIIRDAYSDEILYPFTGLNNAEGFWDGHTFTFSVPGHTRAVVAEFYYQTGEVALIRRGAVQLRTVQLSPLAVSRTVLP